MTNSLDKKSKKNNKKNKSIIILIVFLAILITLVYSTYNYYNYLVSGVSTKENSTEIVFEIPKGSSTKSIAKILLNNNLIKNELAFRIVAKIEEKDNALKAGKYRLNDSMGVYDILESLENGGEKKKTALFTIPEGFELNQIADRLVSLGLVDKDKFIEVTSSIKKYESDYSFIKEIEEDVTLEGFLFPNTYEVYLDATEEDIVRKMLYEFEYVYLNHIKDNNDWKLLKLMTLASIVEREGKVDKERPIIARVFYNRLNIDKKLESCATVQYILGERKVNLTYDDIAIESPYNTYKYSGLPPTPIASPGLKSILATLNPDENDFLYFVLKDDGTGSHVFTTNYKDHIKAKNNN